MTMEVGKDAVIPPAQPPSQELLNELLHAGIEEILRQVDDVASHKTTVTTTTATSLLMMPSLNQHDTSNITAAATTTSTFTHPPHHRRHRHRRCHHHPHCDSQQADENMCLEAPYGHVQPVPLGLAEMGDDASVEEEDEEDDAWLDEEDEEDGEEEEEDENQFTYEYGFNPIVALGKYLAKYNPKNVRTRQAEKQQVSQSSLIKSTPRR